EQAAEREVRAAEGEQRPGQDVVEVLQEDHGRVPVWRRYSLRPGSARGSSENPARAARPETSCPRRRFHNGTDAAASGLAGKNCAPAEGPMYGLHGAPPVAAACAVSNPPKNKRPRQPRLAGRDWHISCGRRWSREKCEQVVRGSL